MRDLSAGQTKATYKLYVEVGVVYAPDGTMIPKYLRLERGGEMLVIDRVLGCQRGVSRKAGGCGICYNVRIRGQDARLFYEDAPGACRWFVETRKPV